MHKRSFLFCQGDEKQNLRVNLQRPSAVRMTTFGSRRPVLQTTTSPPAIQVARRIPRGIFGKISSITSHFVTRESKFVRRSRFKSLK